MHDPTEWLDDYWQQCQYDDSLIESTNLELTMLRNEGTEIP